MPAHEAEPAVHDRVFKFFDMQTVYHKLCKTQQPHLSNPERKLNAILIIPMHATHIAIYAIFEISIVEKLYTPEITIIKTTANPSITTLIILFIKKHLSFYSFTIAREVCHKRDLYYFILI